MKSTHSLAATFAVGLGVLALATACAGGDTATGQQSGAGAGQGGATATVSMRTVNGNRVLVGPAGAALYTNDQDAGGKPTCVSSDCTAVWMPLTVSTGQQPTTGSGVAGKLSTVAVAGGKQQVRLNGKPLYTFALDGQPGQVHGNGAADTFGGTHFTWHSAVPAGAPAPSTPSDAGGGIPGY